MWKVTRKLLGSNARTLVPAGLAIFLVSVFMSCAFLYGSILNLSMRQSLTEVYGGANYAITARDDKGAAAQPDLAERLSKVHDVTGVREEHLVTLDVSVPSGDAHATMVFLQPGTTADLNPVAVVAGKLPSSNNEVVLPQAQAKQLGVAVGDAVALSTVQYDNTGEVSTTRDSAEYTVVGLSSDVSATYAVVGSSGYITDEAMQHFEQITGAAAQPQFHPIYVRIGNLPERVVKSVSSSSEHRVEQQYGSTLQTIRDALPSDVKLVSRADFATERMKQMGGNTADISTMYLLVFAGLAMFVAALVIANTFQVLVAQRTRILALLRTIGAKKGQLYGSVLVEGAVLGIVASVLAVLASMGIVALLLVFGHNTQSMFSVVSVEYLDQIITRKAILVPIIFATVVTVLACMGSARAATRVSPLQALQSVHVVEGKRPGIVSLIFGVILGLGGMAGSLGAIYMAQEAQRVSDASDAEAYANISLLLGMFSCMIIVLGILLLAGRWVPATVNIIGRVVRHIGPSSAVAVGNIRHNPRRIAVTSAALFIGVTLVATLSTGAISLKNTLNNRLGEMYSLDISVDAPHGVLTQQDVQKIADIDGVSAAYAVPYVDMNSAKVGSVRIFTPQSDQQLHEVLNRNDVSLGTPGTLMFPAAYNEDPHSIWKGKQIVLQSNAAANAADNAAANTAQQDYTFALQSASFNGLSEQTNAAVITSPQTLQQLGIRSESMSIWVKVTDSSHATDIVNNVRNTLKGKEHINVNGVVKQRDYYNQMITLMMMVMMALIGIAVVVALIGVANTLLLSVIERTRENATLRAIGMTRSQVRRALAIEAVMIAGVASVAGIIVGTLFGWLGTFIVGSMIGKVTLSVDWLIVAMIVMVAVLCALIASVLPARRAIKTAPVEALAQAD